MHDIQRPHGTTRTTNPDALLSRELGTRQLAANIFNYTVGSGIFVLPAFAVALLGRRGAACLRRLRHHHRPGRAVFCGGGQPRLGDRRTLRLRRDGARAR